MVLICIRTNHFQPFEQFRQNAPIKSMSTTFRTAMTLQSRTKRCISSYVRLCLQTPKPVTIPFTDKRAGTLITDYVIPLDTDVTEER
jgi:hypothetical protein